MLHYAAKSLANKFVVFKNTAQEVEFKECRYFSYISGIANFTNVDV